MNWKRIKREYLCMTKFIEYKYTLFRLSFCIYLKLYGSMTSQTVTIATKPNKDNHQLSDCHSANLFITIGTNFTLQTFFNSFSFEKFLLLMF